VVCTEAQKISFADVQSAIWRLFWGFLLTFLFALSLFAQEKFSVNNQENTIVIDEVKDAEVFAFGKTVIVKKEAKGVLALGGDVIVEGNVEGDVATIGGSVIQREGAFIGGDVIIFGGSYRHEQKEPLRSVGRETIMYAGYEEEFRNLMQNPAQIFAPQLSWAFLAQRLLSTLFWFIVSLAVTTIAPGAVSRAVARFQLSTLKVIGIGFFGVVATTIGVIFSLRFLPNYLSAIVGLMAVILLFLAFVFGRVALQASLGKWLQKKLLAENARSESVALFIGALVWTIFLSVPYLGSLAILALFVASLGLVLTARSPDKWKKF